MSAHRFRTLPQRNTTRGGWGHRHQQARKAAAARHHPSDPCARCGHALGPMGPHLHYDHTDNRTGYLGFSHGSRRCPVCRKRCNLSAAGMAGNAAQARNRGRRTVIIRRAQSRGW